MQPLANVAVMAARAAGKFILRHFDRADTLTVERKGKSDFVTFVDRGAEAEIIQVIRKMYPDHAILGEEGGAQGNVDSDVRWIIDPLDGTTNFLHGIPHFAVSIGVEVYGKLEHGVVYAPCNADLYVASTGDGATLNNRRIRVSRTRQLDDALVGTGFPIRNPERMSDYTPRLVNIANQTAGLRRAGAAALDLAYLAAGRLDVFFEYNLKPWDIAAGMVLVREAGGVVGSLTGGDVLDNGDIWASNMVLGPQIPSLLGVAPRG